MSFGGELFKGYSTDTSTEPFSAGTNLAWSVYNGERSKDKMPVSIWILKKANLDKAPAVAEEIAQILKQEPQNLLKLRHPSFLSILEPVYEDAKQVAFVTERVESTLHLSVKDSSKASLEDELDLKINCKEILVGLKFLNETLRSVHLNVCPEVIAILPNGKWKLSGLTFLAILKDDPSHKGPSSQRLEPMLKVHPNYTYCSPSHFLGFTFNCDVFSFLIVLYQLMCVRSSKHCILPETVGSQTEAQSHISHIVGGKKRGIIDALPSELRQLADQILRSDQNKSLLSELMANEWFDDPRTRILNLIPVFLTKTEQEQKDLVSCLGILLPKFPKKLIAGRIIPFLKEQANNPAVSVYVLSAFIYIIERQLTDVNDAR